MAEAGCSANRYLPITHNSENRSLNHKVNQHGRVWFVLLSLIIFSQFSSSLLAQIYNFSSTRQVYGSVVTAQGQAVADAAVEIRDLRGVEMASGSTDSKGRFVIHTSAQPGEYIILAARRSQTKDERVILPFNNDVEVQIALPAPIQGIPSNASRNVVSASTLGVPEKARQRLLKAQKEFSKGNLTATAQELEDAIRIDPQFAQAFSMRALVSLALRNFFAAADDAERATLIDPSDENAYTALATACNSMRQFERAQHAAERVLAINADSWPARLEIAKSEYGLGKFVLALRELDLLKPDFADFHLVRANILMRLERNQEASEEFRIFIKEAPADPRAVQVAKIVASNTSTP